MNRSQGSNGLGLPATLAMFDEPGNGFGTGAAHAPAHWECVPVESVGDVILGRQRSPENHSGPNMRPYMRAANITWAGLDLTDVKEMNFDAGDFGKFRLHVGDVLVNEGSGSAKEIGKPVIWKGEIDDCCFQNTVIAVRPRTVSPEYLYYVLLHAAMSGAFAAETRGVNIHHIGRGGLAKFCIPLPPSDEQAQIIATLDSAFRHIQGVKFELDRVKRLATRSKHAVLANAFLGTLTADDASGWPIVTLGDLISNIDAGKNVRCVERLPMPHERGVVKISSVSWGEFDPTAVKTPTPGIALEEHARIGPGDFLISRANTLELVGACVIVGPSVPSNLYLSDKVLRLRFREPVEHWVLHFLRSDSGRRQIQDLATGNQLAMRNISQSSLRAVRVPLPPIEVRNRIVARVETLLGQVDRAHGETSSATRLLERLRAASLAKLLRPPADGRCVTG